MFEKDFLMIPGPTPVPLRVLRALSKQMINHRGPEFADLITFVHSGLQELFKTKNDILIFPAAGTGAMEAAIVNAFSKEDKILGITIGAFGDRFIKIAKAYGLEVDTLSFEWGEVANLKTVEEKLTHGNYKGILVTQNETSTGAVNDIENIAKLAKKANALILVDAISGLGAVDLKTDEWEIDFVVAGSQKAMMLPPGLAFVSVNANGWEAQAKSNLPKYYWNFKDVKSFQDKNQNPYTPPVSLIYGLKESIEIIREEGGWDKNFVRHNLLRDMLRVAIEKLGLEPLVKNKEYSSPGVTAIKSPAGVEVGKFRKFLKEKFAITTAGGQGKLKEIIFRIGHLGWCSQLEIFATICALEITLKNFGFKIELGSGVAEAEKVVIEKN